ncbi:hypothetical protein KMW28_03555 [Flammeovirga yaeyamensis]|uniref:Uncharacterized protein n=1 Tax=Flammeovirga yaeyamensis TaxID=367791 RepID=A0AAX1N521_9BACT|nr:hypothetical protein [Flammeovirga yaeyamensis]MBB3701277.1 hypothetical protein [Flammeovirga yaeyamensis]NMF38253.1 hypothetical protein [Flammeovirga yaeyamensis]QWG02664.1 hypothetical protein KMW28_03555 [Flammeovirga yaeyamensis]
MSFILMIVDRWQFRPLPLVIRYFMISAVALLSFNTIISQSKSHWFQEMMSEQWVLMFFSFLIIEMGLGILFSRFSSNSIIQKVHQLFAFVPRPTSICAILLIEILVFDAVHGWSFKAVSITYAISLMLIGVGTYFLFRNHKSINKLKSVIVTVFSILQLLLISTLINPQKLENSVNASFDVQSSLIVLLLFLGFALVGFLISLRKSYGLRK